MTTQNQHAQQFHDKLVAAGLRPATSSAEDYSEERKADPNWRRPVEEPKVDTTDWNQTRRDLL